MYIRYNDISGQKFGREMCIDHKHMLYMPLSVAKELGYSILDKWVEEI